MTTYVQKMKDLQKAVDHVDAVRVGGDAAAYEFWYWLQDAIWSAEQNGRDTMIENRYVPDAERQAEFAHGSICCTLSFDKPEVREWFAAHKYKW